MSAPETTETTASERWRAEQAHVQTPEGAREAVARDHANLAMQVERNLREQWGGDESGYQRARAAQDIARERYGVTAEQFRRDLGMSREGAEEHLRQMGEAAVVIEAATTPAEARERLLELRKDLEFGAKLDRGDVLARKTLSALQDVVAYGRRR